LKRVPTDPYEAKHTNQGVGVGVEIQYIKSSMVNAFTRTIKYFLNVVICTAYNKLILTVKLKRWLFYNFFSFLETLHWMDG
jgi:hypothetical protein